MVYPEYNEVYTLYEMLKSLDLPDCPFLQFFYNGVECVIQTSHVSNEELLNIPGMSESKWHYKTTTHEWIPIFEYTDDNIDILELVDIHLSKRENEYDEYWVTPKGYPRVECV